MTNLVVYHPGDDGDSCLNLTSCSLLAVIIKQTSAFGFVNFFSNPVRFFLLQASI